MKTRTFVWLAAAGLLAAEPAARYRHAAGGALAASVVRTFTLSTGPRGVSIHAIKAGGGEFRVWRLDGRYAIQEGASRPVEYRNAVTGEAVLPTQVDPALLFPKEAAAEIEYLGHRYVRESVGDANPAIPANPRVVDLRPDLLIGPASNTRQKDETRRYDGSDYELIRMNRADYRLMRDSGVTCVRADEEQARWADELGMYYWGPAAGVPFPESLYRVQYLGPALYLDEPAVGTRDHVIRPRLEKDPAYRKTLTPKLALEEFRKYYDHAWREGAPTAIQRELKARPGVDLGSLDLRQWNLYSWETMPSTAAWQLSRDPHIPAAMVFEPPGRIGSRRTLPEMSMTYGVPFTAGDPRQLTDLIFGFLRGAARATGKEWGVSIYGAVERADAPYWLTRAYDMGATRFFFWDNYQLACVPFGEVLALARHLRDHASGNPRRDLVRLRKAAEVAILLPPGYDLGHVRTGKGSMWGVDELNLERRNRAGVPYRTVMSNFFAEAARCMRAGIAFDQSWDLPELRWDGYREVVRVREDGKVEVTGGGRTSVLPAARALAAPGGSPPELTVTVEAKAGIVIASARVRETGAPVFYTLGAGTDGVYRNALVAWELYGPAEEDCQIFAPPGLKPDVTLEPGGGVARARFPASKPGRYRLRAATVDAVGRTTVVWREFATADR